MLLQKVVALSRGVSGKGACGGEFGVATPNDDDV